MGFPKSKSATRLKSRTLKLFIAGTLLLGIAVGLAIVVSLFRHTDTADVDEMNLLKR